eukprot:TRINITY_DN4398_c0_g1_i2.p1 TRINITY_DN4398_c0_g1~~TRINITY_DN4398_c0_g1_i2.p1  ORF type:complete len:368 (-),score=64.33 TRINITY_DN4398_c0_g1_i2:103-1206(-)
MDSDSEFVELLDPTWFSLSNGDEDLFLWSPNTDSGSSSTSSSSRRRASDTTTDDDSGRVVKRARRARTACGLCRKLKQRCDDRRPCSRCVGRGRQDECKDAVDEPSSVDKDDTMIDYSELFTRLTSVLKPQQIHDMIVNQPLKWVAFLGFVSRWTNELTCLKIRCRLISEALCVQTPETLPVLTEVNPLKEIHFHEVEFKRLSLKDRDVLSEEFLERICHVFNVRDVERSDVAILQVMFFPHKDGPHAAKVRYLWNHALEKLLGIDFKTFFERSLQQWRKLAGGSAKADRAAIPPAFWNLFSVRSLENLLQCYFGAWFEDEFERVEQLEVKTCSGEIVKCCVLWKMAEFPLIEIPSSSMLAMRALST